MSSNPKMPRPAEFYREAHAGIALLKSRGMSNLVPSFLLMLGIESSYGHPNILSNEISKIRHGGTDSYTGLGQFGKEAWQDAQNYAAKHNITYTKTPHNRTDPYIGQGEHTALYMLHNADILAAALGIHPSDLTPAMVYAGHNQGINAAVAIFTADADTPVSELRYKGSGELVFPPSTTRNKDYPYLGADGKQMKDDNGNPLYLNAKYTANFESFLRITPRDEQGRIISKDKQVNWGKQPITSWVNPEGKAFHEVTAGDIQKMFGNFLVPYSLSAESVLPGWQKPMLDALGMDINEARALERTRGEQEKRQQDARATVRAELKAAGLELSASASYPEATPKEVGMPNTPITLRELRENYPLIANPKLALLPLTELPKPLPKHDPYDPELNNIPTPMPAPRMRR